MTRYRRSAGFTLVELAVALVVVAVLAGGVLLAARVQLTQRQTSETRQALEEAREALLAYAAANGHLPCPAQGGAPGQGLEWRNGSGACPTRRGILPWQELGIQAIDGWGRRLAYMPSAPLTVSGFGLTTAPGSSGSSVTYDSLSGMVVISAGTATGASLSSAGSVAAAVWSWGANGRYASLPDGSTIPNLGAGPDEAKNGAGTDYTVVSRDESENTSDPGGTFDDQVIWISRYVLFGRMMSAGQLP